MFSIKENDKLFRLSALKQICQSSKYLAYIDINKYDSITLQDLINRSNNMSMLEMPIYLSKYAIKCGVSMLESYFPKIRKYIKSENISVVIEPDEKMYIMEHGHTRAVNNIFFIVSKNLVLGALSTSIADIKERIFKDAVEQTREVMENKDAETRSTNDSTVRENYDFPTTTTTTTANTEEYTNALSPDLQISNTAAAAAAATASTDEPNKILSPIAILDDNNDDKSTKSIGSKRSSSSSSTMTADEPALKRPRSCTDSVVSSNIAHEQSPNVDKVRPEEEEEEFYDNDAASSCFTSVSQRPVNEDPSSSSSRAPPPSPPPLEIDTNIAIIDNKKFSDKDFFSLLGSLSPTQQQQQQQQSPASPAVSSKKKKTESIVRNNGSQKFSNGIDELLDNISFN